MKILNKKIADEVLNQIALKFAETKRSIEVSLTTENFVLNKKYCSDKYLFKKLRDSSYIINEYGESLMTPELEINLSDIENVSVNSSKNNILLEISNESYEVKLSIDIYVNEKEPIL